ncbi:sigma-70 family RNA polymerase sigma factor [Pigmentiphaga aceris]|uniref:Sigma-70 family RNA polymerase sigma factor n=1 Tax=Pigmentiphaga aceris TaxID=1940612 RepID=A0A5C0B384_9BURK|nr:sigma-70 family RNA polymerase sigma factor [Pigmentiphaga aceris]
MGALYAAHQPWLQRWLRGKLDCQHHAADIAQDTFVRVLGKAEPVEMREPRSYLARIAQGLVYDYRRRQKLEQLYLDALAQLPEAHAPSPETRALHLEALVELDALLDRLPTPVRKAFLLSQLSGLSHAEIAAELKISVATVKRHIVRAVVQCCLDA